MATTAHFQLFPPPPPRTNHSPARKGGRRHNGKNTAYSPVSPILEVGKSPSGAEAVVIQIIEPTRATPIQIPPAAIVSDSRSSPSDTRRFEQAGTPQSDSPLRSRAVSPATHESNSPTLFRSNTAPSPSPSGPSPVIRMQSMFPRFNPTVPLNQQKYFPVRNASPTNLPAEVVQRGEYSPGATSPSQIDTILGGPKTAPASVLNFPLDALDPAPNSISSSSHLQTLWEVANGQFEGQTPQQSLGVTFVVEMSRSEEATFVFGPTDSASPFYSIQTFSTNEFTVARHHPLKNSLHVPVMMSSFESQPRLRSPYDGLVALLFPQLAHMLAIDEATELRVQNHLAPDVAEQIAADAVKRACQLEGCRLTYNDTHSRYELFMPCLAAAQNEELRITPPESRSQSPTGDPTVPGMLHIHVQRPSPMSPSSSVVGYATSSDPVILVTNPFSHVQKSPNDPANARTSTLSVPSEDEASDGPLVSLDFNDLALSIAAARITSTIPSLYAIDTIVSAILAVAVADEATNRVMAALPVGVRRARRLYSAPSIISGMPRRSSRTAGSIRSVTTSHTHVQPKLLVATLAERSDHPALDDDSDSEELKLMAALRSKSIKSPKSATTTKSNPSPKSKSKSKDRGKLKTKKIVVVELDVEKYSEGGEELPSMTRGALKFMFLGLRSVVWILTIMVEFLAWILVKTTRWVTSENF